MAKIIIKNIGPIKDVQFDLNKINVFMGPQSSGKSTIAKIISYCTWVEKDVATSQSLETYQKNKNYFREHIENFHKIKGYFRPESYLLYKSDVVEIKWEDQQSEIKWVDRFAYHRSKISYIPSERNMIILPEVKKVELGNTNIRSFLFDWFDARKNYPKENRLSVLNLNVDYYYVEGGVNEEDYIRGVENNKMYEILLSSASSGLQSVTPLLVMIDYLAKWIYKEEKTSFDQEEKIKKAFNRIKFEMIYKSYFNIDVYPSNDQLIEYSRIVSAYSKVDKGLNNKVEQVKEIRNQLFITQNTQMIIEEPEQNLFPETQRELIYHLFEKCFNREGNRLTITTHSPYILYALNNCMMGYLVKDSMPDDEISELKSKNSWINPDLVSVWEIENGNIRPIKNNETGTISKHYFNGIMNDVMEEYYDMLTYLNLKDNEG